MGAPAGGRAGAHAGTPPGTSLAAPHAAETMPDPARFAVLTTQVQEIQARRLGIPHRLRARFRPGEDWKGRWIAP